MSLRWDDTTAARFALIQDKLGPRATVQQAAREGLLRDDDDAALNDFLAQVKAWADQQPQGRQEP